MKTSKKLTELEPYDARDAALGGDIGNGAKPIIDTTLPYSVEVSVRGIAPLLFHRWQSDEVAAKAAAAKNSKAKKTDNLESYVYRMPNGNLGLPGVYLIGSMTNQKNGAAKYRQDPRSPRKSALDLYKAAIQPLTELADLSIKDWDYEDRRRVVIQNNGITRVRPALHIGWTATFELICTMPEYVSPDDLLETLNLAGRAVGVGDFRPTYGRFAVVHFDVTQD